jgi:hypothetical protein
MSVSYGKMSELYIQKISIWTIWMLGIVPPFLAFGGVGGGVNY